MITSDYPRFEIGDLVRVKVARRRDAFFTVAEASENRVRAVNDRGAEAIYAPDAFELVRDAQPEALDDAEGGCAPPLQPWRGLEPVTAPPTAPRSSPGTSPFDAAEFSDSGMVRALPGESLEGLLRRFKRSVAKAGILSECRDNQHFTPEPQRRRDKARRALARRKKSAISLDKLTPHREAL